MLICSRQLTQKNFAVIINRPMRFNVSCIVSVGFINLMSSVVVGKTLDFAV